VYALAPTVYNSAVDIGSNDKRFTAAASETSVSDSSPIAITVDGQTLKQTLTSGTGLDDFKTVPSGEITIERAGLFHLGITSTKERGGLVMHLRAVLLNPVADN
jgi:hypothetical protein